MGRFNSVLDAFVKYRRIPRTKVSIRDCVIIATILAIIMPLAMKFHNLHTDDYLYFIGFIGCHAIVVIVSYGIYRYVYGRNYLQTYTRLHGTMPNVLIRRKLFRLYIFCTAIGSAAVVVGIPIASMMYILHV